MLSAPLRDRFGIISHMEYYEDQDLKEIVLRSADIFQTEIVEEGAFEIARRSRGTPRIANRLLKRVRDFAQVQANGIIDRQIADKSFAAFASRSCWFRLCGSEADSNDDRVVWWRACGPQHIICKHR